MVAVDILSGFLGSGKTTLLRHVLGHGLRDRRVAVVMNEVGDVGIDGDVVRGFDAVERMVELSSGCICCTIDTQRLDRALHEIVRGLRPHLVVIETTGLADPLATAARVRAAGLSVDAVVTMVDAAAVGGQLAREPVARTQIAAADFLVLNKVDLVTAPELTRVERRLERLNGRAHRWRTTGGVVDADLLFATGVAAHRRRARRGEHRPGSIDMDTVVYRSDGDFDLGRFERVMRRLPPAVVRAKGILRIAGREARCLFNFTSGRHELSWLPLPGVRASELVFIGRDLGRHERSLRRALARCQRTGARALVAA